MTSSRIGAAAAIVDTNDRFLLVKHPYGRCNWELPGAGAEVAEETSLQVVAGRLVGVYYEPDTDMHHFVFVCHQLDELAAPRPDRVEISACEYWPPDALPRPISDFTIRRVRDVLTETAAAWFITVPPRQWFD